MDFETALKGFLAAADAKVQAAYASDVLKVTHKIEAGVGTKFIRIVHASYKSDGTITSRSAYCFVEKASGNVLKAAGWKAPAKGVRSNIYAADFGASGITPYGAVYHN